MVLEEEKQRRISRDCWQRTPSPYDRRHRTSPLLRAVFVAVSTKPSPFFLVIELSLPTGLEGRGRVDLRLSSHCRCSSPSHRRFSSLSRESPVVALVLLAAPLPPWALRILLAEPLSLPALLLVGSLPGLLSRCHCRPSSSLSRYRCRPLLAEPPTALLLLVSSEERERERERERVWWWDREGGIRLDMEWLWRHGDKNRCGNLFFCVVRSWFLQTVVLVVRMRKLNFGGGPFKRSANKNKNIIVDSSFKSSV